MFLRSHVTTGQPEAVRRHLVLVTMRKIDPGLTGLGKERSRTRTLPFCFLRTTPAKRGAAS
jgi:hypothetical protein